MKRISFSHFWLSASVSLALWGAVACGDSLGLPPASFPNFVDTVTLFALRGTPITTPSAYDILTRTAARTDTGAVFDFAFDFDSTGAAVLFPAGVLGLPPEAGLQLSTETFESIVRAPTDEYVVDSVLTISVGNVFIGRSRNSAVLCVFLGALPRYGKFRVLDVNRQDRTVTLESLVDLNCGFRGLEPGFPTS